jgi:phospholipid/cholesterol/gamma-HCH transport system permease protein
MTPVDFLEHLGNYTAFAWRSLWAAPRALLRPGELLSQLYHVLLGALPLSVVAGLAVGAVVWMHLRSSVEQTAGAGAVELLPQALALAVVLEFGPISAGLIVAGRSGASLGAELGSMRLTEQIDALEVLGLSPLRYLVAPRVLACVLALPLLTEAIDVLALLSGFLAETVSGGGMSWTRYQSACLGALSLGDAVPATLRTVIFGYLIGVTGCYFGLSAHGGTEGVGRAATRSVVVSILLVLVADVLLVRAIQVARQSLSGLVLLT